MFNKNSPCSSDRIAKFFDDLLDEEEARAFEAHLETCAACREAAEKNAASDAEWTEARSLLSSSGAEAVAVSSPVVTPLPDDDDPAPAGVAPILSLLAPTDDPRMLGRIGTYEISGVVGRGGMGVVLKGWDAALSRYVAIKLLAPELAASGAARRRFAREAQAAAAVVHENVIEIHGVSEIGGVPYLVMPYVRGFSLQKRIDRNGPLELAEILRIGMHTASGLAAAHAQGLIHRDVKPANILLSETVERIKLTDFGLARAIDDASLTRTGVIAGTPEYMSPEQVNDEPIDTRSDLFSLGSVMYAMCTGRSPFRAETTFGVLRRISSSQPKAIREINAGVPAWLERVVMRLLSKSPTERFESAEEVSRVLERCLAHVQQPTAVPLPAEVRAGRSRRKVIKRAGGVVIACAIGIAGLFAWFGPTNKEVKRSMPVADAAIEVAAGKAAPETKEAAPAWNDGLGAELQSIDQQLEQLERSTRD